MQVIYISRIVRMADFLEVDNNEGFEMEEESVSKLKVSWMK